MISAKLAVLMVTMAMIGVGLTGATPLAMAQQSSDVDIERNNEIEQSIEQSQEACTNEAEVSVSDDDVIGIGGENEVEVVQSNECEVTQSQTAANVATIVDESENTFDISQFLLDIDVPDINTDCAFINGQFVCR
jgi:type II secretory pathway pseudopilin PulG